MPITGTPVYLSTLLLEKNRSNGKGPSLLVSDWLEPISEAGFGGLEIWMNHLLFSSRSEWELIRERGLEADLAIACISSTLPADGLEKNRRLRDTLVEACDYFRPESLKLTLARGEAGVDFVREWVRDLPREVGVLLDVREGEAGTEGIGRLRQALPGDRFRAVLHPFLLSPRELEDALAAAGDFVGNLGVQAKKEGRWALLSDSREESAALIAAVRRRNYRGSWSCEYTRGAGLPGEDIDDLFDNAEADFNFLTESLSRSPSEKA